LHTILFALWAVLVLSAFSFLLVKYLGEDVLSGGGPDSTGLRVELPKM
jgi:hypothetical protein